MTENKSHQLLIRMCGVALFGALSYLLTALARIPYAGGNGYFNFGDAVDLLVAMVFGPLEGALVGILGGVLSDLTMGYAAYAPFTLAAKGLMGLVAGYLYIVLKNRKYIRFSSLFIGGLLEVLVYLIAYFVFLGAPGIVNSLFDLVQAFGSALLAIPLFLALEKSKVIEKLL